MFSFVRNCQTLPKWLYHFTFPVTMSESYISLLECGGISVVDFSRSSRCVVVFHCHFSLWFPSDV